MITNKHKDKEARKALIKAIIFFVVLIGGGALVLLWAARSEDSAVAAQIRKTVGIPSTSQPAPEPVSVEPEAMVEVVPEPEPMVIPVEPEPEPIPSINYLEITQSKHLWPDTLQLVSSKKVSFRYGSQTYGYMEFVEGSTVTVHALKAPGEIYCSINGNFISLAVEETNFTDWFQERYAERYVLQPILKHSASSEAPIAQLDTPEVEKTFWNQMRIWCHKNYESISLEIGKDQLVFRWLPKEDAPINFQMEAREIARTYLLMRAALGGTENYAACEIRHPVTNELLGASSIFIPRL